MIITSERRYRIRVATDETELNSPQCIMNASNTGNLDLAVYSAIEDVREYEDGGVSVVDQWNYDSDIYQVISKFTYSKDDGLNKINIDIDNKE